MSETEPSWPDDMDAAERVGHVATTRTEPRNAGWIAEEAAVARDTAVKYLTRMVDRGELVAIETSDGTCYRPDTVTQFLDTVREFAAENTIEELTAELEAISTEIDEWKREYDVESLTDLRQSLGDESRSEKARKARREVIDEWAYNVEMREAIQLAISLQDALASLGTDSPSTSLAQES